MAAKLLHPLLFCNDINLKTILSIIICDEDHILITCKSFVKKFNFNHRKQVNSWITKSWLPFTGGAVKDGCNQIHAVVSQTSLVQWSLEDKDLENSKRTTFKSKIESLKTCQNSIYIVYSCGYIECLETGLKSRKEVKSQVINENETILDCHIFEDRKEGALLAQNKDGDYYFYKLNIEAAKAFHHFKISFGNFRLSGYAIFSSGNLMTAWSDGNIYSLNIFEKTHSIPGISRGSLSPLKCTRKIKILELSSNHIVVQGMNANEEGGLLLLMDTKFGVLVNSKPLKMYRDPPLVWSVAAGVVVGDGGCLIYIPVTISVSTVASMFGSRLTANNVEDSEHGVGWETSLDDKTGKGNVEIPVDAVLSGLSNKSPKLSSIVRSLEKGSTSENIVVSHVVSKLLEKRNLDLLAECLSVYDSIPERSLIDILNFLIRLPEEYFEVSGAKKSHKKIKKKALQNSSNELSTSFVSESEKQTEGVVASPFSPAKSKLVNEVLIKSFTISELLSVMHLIDFKNSLVLLEFLHYLLASGEASVVEAKDSKVPTIEIVSLWLSLLLDSNYHQFVMSSEVEVQRRLLTCFSDISSLHDFLSASYELDTLIDKILNSTPLPPAKSDSLYNIEKLVL